MAEHDPYRLLGVERDATPDEIRAAFRKAVRRSHPDTAAGTGGEDVQSVIDAYRLLSDPAARDRYDRSVGPLRPGARSVDVRRAGSGAGRRERRARTRCEACAGTGSLHETRTCPACEGRAEVTRLDGRMGRVVRCRLCRGGGTVRSTRPCDVCSGSGLGAG
jgi:DnaJ-class molecular chaperone